MTKNLKKYICIVFLIIFTFTIVSPIISFDFTAAQKRFSVGYNFDASDSHIDMEKNFSIPSSTPISLTTGRNSGKAAYGGFSIPSRMFLNRSAMSIGFWTKIENYEEYATRDVFFVGKEGGSTAYIKIVFDAIAKEMVFTVYDGSSSRTIRGSVEDYITGSSSEWIHLAITYGPDSGGYSFKAFINGVCIERSVTSTNLVSTSPSYAGFGLVTVDDYYFTNIELSEEKISTLRYSSLLGFLAREKDEWKDPSGAEDPDIPNEGDDDSNVVPISFSWLAYTFDTTMDLTHDLNKKNNCAIDVVNVKAVNTEDYRGKTGNAIARAVNSHPEYYLQMHEGLLYAADGFTISAYVYGHDINGSTITSTMFDFIGVYGRLTFSPFSTSGGVFEYTNNSDISATKSIGTTNISGKWTHFAFTFNKSGQVTTYVNGKATNTIDTGLSLPELKLYDLKVVTNTAGGESSRVVLDEVYVYSKTMEAVDIRKIHHYGVNAFVTSALPDPETGEMGNGETNEEDLRPDSDDILEDAFTTTAIINGYIGTTFDNPNFMGEDYNSSVPSTLRNASLAEGFVKYGLALNGTTSYMRYPLEILDGINELTISMAYNWAGADSKPRNQRLFDFSAKNNSITSPTAYIYLDMGDGTSGISLNLSDGTNSTEVKADVNTIDEWARVTATVKGGTVKLYINDKVVGQASTKVNLSEINPNFCYIGKSAIKGDPLFNGIVDEIYISAQEITSDQIARLSTEGIAPADGSSDDKIKKNSVWSVVITCILVVIGCVIALVITLIVIALVKAEKKKRLEEGKIEHDKKTKKDIKDIKNTIKKKAKNHDKDDDTDDDMEML